MAVAEHIKASFSSPDTVVRSYLEDLADADLLVRPVPGTNHIAWQLGHLISSEHKLIEAVCPGSMPKLPDGFHEKYAKGTASSDDPNQFHTKQQYFQLLTEQRAGTLAALAKLSDEQLAAPSPKGVQMLGPTVGSIFAAQNMHWMMHAGQWAVTRRKLGRAPLF